MTTKRSYLILTVATFMAAFLPLRASAISSEIKDFRLANCGSKAKSRCLKVNAASAQGSSFKQLFVLNDIEVTLTDKNQRSLRSWHSKSGYYDLEENRVVLFDAAAKNSQEIVFEFSDVDTMKWKL